MKIQKLTIHNLASIEDAVIDFDASPLRDSEVFLITGKTGAGKSTILDAICLALYADSPRLSRDQKNKHTIDTDNNVGIGDPRQLMRRNTGEAFVSLTFTGSNSIHYEATWSVARARGKATGKLQNKKWSLKNLDTDYTLNKDEEIKREMKVCIGLDFNQFCRTTVLAQGEFTRFLYSEDNAKAEILEKITGVDTYSKIGARVYELTNMRQQEWQKAQEQLKDIKVLSDDEVHECQTKLTDCTNQCKQLETDNKRLDDIIRWMEADTDLQEKIHSADSQYQSAARVVTQSEFKEKEQIVKQWNDTIEARGWLDDRNKAISRQQQLKQHLAQLSSTYLSITARLIQVEGMRDQLAEKCTKMTDFISSESEKKPVYDHAQTIVLYLQQLAKLKQDIQLEYSRKEATQHKRDGQLQQALTDAKTSLNASQEQLVNQQALWTTFNNQLTAVDMPKLRNHQIANQQQLTAVEKAQEKLTTYQHDRAQWIQRSKDIRDQQQSIAIRHQEQEELQQPLHDAKIRWDTQRQQLDNLRETVDQWAKHIRSELHIGDRCPVCHQPITIELPHEDVLDQLYADALKRCQKSEDDYQKLIDKQNALKVEIESLAKMLANNQTSLANDSTWSISESELRQACAYCSISVPTLQPVDEVIVNTTDDTTDSISRQLIAQYTRLTSTAQSLQTAMNQGEQLETDIKATQARLNKLTTRCNQDKESVNTVHSRIVECTALMESSKLQIEKYQQEQTTIQETLRQLVTPMHAHVDWTTSPQEFINELTNAVQTYSDTVKACDTAQFQLTQLQTDIDRMKDTIQNILICIPEWKRLSTISNVPSSNTIDPIKNYAADQLLNFTHDLHAQLQSIQDQLAAAQDAEASANKKLDTCVDSVKLTALSQYSSSFIQNMNKELQICHNQELSAHTRLEQLQGQYKEHQQQKPSFSETDTTVTLRQVIQHNLELLSVETDNQGKWRLQLMEDEKNKAQQSQLIVDEAQRHLEYKKWSVLNQLIGDATGNKFRRIAQSYVLSSLVHTANSYMKTLTPRYLLKVQPGTFVITLEDAYQGYVSRPASTISGGESFLVSLSLALALSDISQQLSVDTLFIDEGFGTLSGDPLQHAINTLRTLHHHGGRHVGIISHVEELRERIPVQIQVQQEGNNSSSKITIT